MPYLLKYKGIIILKLYIIKLLYKYILYSIIQIIYNMNVYNILIIIKVNGKKLNDTVFHCIMII